ncbi:hypothetical protein BGZ73_005565 [Actinomortierella ambigua]|nr:hypothetical protein BGZ73_005565 [Actinomortierella ambigua]
MQPLRRGGAAAPPPSGAHHHRPNCCAPCCSCGPYPPSTTSLRPHGQPPFLDPAKQHPAFAGTTFYQQRRVHVTMTPPHATPPQPLSSSTSSTSLPAMLDPARTSPIFYGYVPKTDKPKM